MSSSMLPFHLNQAATVHYMAERDGDQGHPSPFTLPSDASPFRPCPILFNSLQDQGDRDHCHIQQYPLKHQASEQLLISGTSNLLVSNTLMDDAVDNGDNLKLSLCDHYVKEEQAAHVPSKWMSSKMRIMKKMMNSSPDRHVGSVDARPREMQAPQDRSQRSMQVFGASNDNSSPCGIIRVCSDCHTTKTPLWRSGPCGPKSLCNACGIRQRKARRAMAAAAAASGGLLPPPHHHAPTKVRKEKKFDVVDRTVPFKKRCKVATASSAAQAKLCFEDVTLSLSTSSTFDRVFPQDERDAAILLMALSCGLIRS